MEPTKRISITLQASEWRVLAMQLLMLQNTVPVMTKNENIKAVLAVLKQSGVLDGKDMARQLELIKDSKYRIDEV